MSLPSGFLDELRTRLSISQVVGRKVMWDSRKSNQGKGDMWAPCPFHQEKTSSFHVDDRKGYYYCFGCHAKGDAISFVRETENVSFMEAVEILAGEAGMPMPARDPQAQQKSDRRSQLVEVMETAVRFFRMQLQSGSGADARAYLDRRGQPEGWLDRWEIGFALDGWQGLWDHLRGKGVAEDLIFGAGLAKPSQKGGKAYDVFRNRIMFPIRDAQGRCIAFGGRAMDPNDPAKYLNSPETELFDKGRNLYNHKPARAAAGKGHDLIVAEGYMDVIALVEAGFQSAVAPLGTAVTETQLALLWRISPEPIIVLDGDKAGRRAAQRLIDLALPALSDGNSLFFAGLPEGQDPDDFLKAHGKEALAKILTEEKKPLVRALWDREWDPSQEYTPEQRAGLDKRVRAAVAQIPDADIKRYYGEALKTYRWDAFKPKNYAPEYKRKPARFERPGGPTAQTKASWLAVGDTGQSEGDRIHVLRERMVAALSFANPSTARQFREGLERFEVADMAARMVLSGLIAQIDDPVGDDLRDLMVEKLGASIVGQVLDDPFVRLHPATRKELPADIVIHEIAENITRVETDRAAALELDEASEDIFRTDSEAITWRLGQSAAARQDAQRGMQEDTTEYDIAPTGAQVSRDEKGAFESLISTIRFSKSGQ